MLEPNDGSGVGDRSEHRHGAADRFGHLFELIDDAVVEIEFVETTPIVRAVNPAFEELFGFDEEAVLGESLNEFIIPAAYDQQADSFDERTAAGKANHAIVHRQTATGIREFLYRGVPYERPDGRQFGFAIYSDITEQRRYERHIQVIHRILRHNLRNELTVILGVANMLECDAESRTVEQRAAQIQTHANELAAIGTEAKVLEDILTGDRQTGSIDVAVSCRHARKHTLERCPEGTVHLDVPETAPVEAIPELETAIAEIVENGLVHNDSPNPEVSVSLQQTETQVVLDIADNGPGIPTAEQTVFNNESITQLQHGTGLGLWLARCATELSDGVLDYERTADGESTVTLHLRPAADKPAE